MVSSFFYFYLSRLGTEQCALAEVIHFSSAPLLDYASAIIAYLVQLLLPDCLGVLRPFCVLAFTSVRLMSSRSIISCPNLGGFSLVPSLSSSALTVSVSGYLIVKVIGGLL